MTLEDWDKNVKPHLDLIANGAEIAARNAIRLPIKPGWRTASQDQLHDARTVLETALQKIIAAQAAYESKPVEA